MGCGCASFGLHACTSVPITERKQLRLIPEAKLNAQAEKLYEKVKEKEKLSKDITTLNKIKNIGSKIENSITEYFARSNQPDPTANFRWEYILIENKKVKNAWCMPGGKIAVYTGMLDITKNDNGLAAVMGHEIAHAVAKHSVERASRGTLLNVGTKILDIATKGAVSNVNRTTGISGYDIRETVKIWERMREANKGKEPPEFMSTHPSSTNRINNITSWINEVTLEYPPIS